METSTAGGARADCSRCAGLCCVALAFDRSPLFAFDKPAGAACRHLTVSNRCELHDRLQTEGFAGCARYDCGGTGPRVVSELFPARSWREGPETAAAIFDAFRALREIDELRALLAATDGLALGPRHARTVTALAAALAPPGGWSLTALDRFEEGPLPARIRGYLRSLRWQVPLLTSGRTPHPSRPGSPAVGAAPSPRFRLTAGARGPID